MYISYPSCDRETKPVADGAGARACGVDTVEAVEDAAVEGMVDADACILHGEEGAFMAASQADVDAASGWCVFDGVFEQRTDHAAQEGAIAKQRDGFDGGEFKAE